MCGRWVTLLTLLLICLFAARGTEPDFYELLGVERSASTREIRKAFKSIALEKHPDKTPDDPEAHDKFLRINRAYEVLKDDDLRRKYDVHGEEGLKEGAPSGSGYRSWNFYHQEFGIYDNDDEIITLSRSDFEMSVQNSEDVWFINFYSPMCPHCHDLAPTWREVARELEGVVRIGAVNCAEDRGLCQQEGVRGYPSLFIYPKREKFNGDRTREELLGFALRHANTRVLSLIQRDFDATLKTNSGKPWLVTYCADSGDCLDDNTLLKVSAVLEAHVVVAALSCHDHADLCERLAVEAGTVYYSEGLTGAPSQRGQPIDSLNAQEVAQSVLKHLPDLPLISPDNFQTKLAHLQEGRGQPCLIHFFETDSPMLDLRKLPRLLGSLQVARVDCRESREHCDALHLRRLPVFALFRQHGGHEVYHGRHIAHDLAIFARDVATSALRTLTPSDFPALVDSGERWMVDFFSPTCPPCLRLLPELRKASRMLGDVKFGSVNCATHSQLCSQYNVRSYPTAIFYNQTKPHQFIGHHYAQDVVDFIQDTLEPPVIHLDLETFQNTVKNKPDDQIWLIDYYAPWCGPCRQLLPEWTRLAKMLRDSALFRVASVDCVEQEALCQLNGIHSYPSIRLYAQGPLNTQRFHTYNGWFRDAHNLRQWALGFKPSRAIVLTSGDFTTRVLRDPMPWMVEFHTQWCGHCQRFAPEFELVAERLEGRVKVGKVDCDAQRHLCHTTGIRAYPTVYLYIGASRGGQQSAQGELIHNRDAASIVNLVTNRLEIEQKLRKTEL